MLVGPPFEVWTVSRAGSGFFLGGQKRASRIDEILQRCQAEWGFVCLSRRLPDTPEGLGAFFCDVAPRQPQCTLPMEVLASDM